MKKLSALLAALVITGVIGLGILVIGVSALANRNTVALQDAPNASLASSNIGNTTVSSDLSASEVQQLRQQVSDTQAQLDQANLTIQQYQALLLALQQRGVITIGEDGRIYVPNAATAGKP